MRLKKSHFIGLILAVMLSLGLATPAMAAPQIPHAFYGNVTIGGEPAPDGIVISARIGSTEYETTTTVDGKYGYSPTFMVPADDPETPEKEGGVNGDTIEFYLQGSKVASCTFANGQVTPLDLEAEVLPDFNITVSPSSVSVRRPGSALVSIQITGVGEFSEVVSLSATGQPGGVTVEFSQESGTVPFNSDMNLNVGSTTPIGSHTITIVGSSSVKDHQSTLTLTVTAPAVGGGPGAPLAVTTVSLTGLSATVPLRVDAEGIVQATTRLSTADGKLSLDIAAGTKLLDAQGNPLSSFTAAIEPSPAAPPPDAAIILAYDLGPDGATFSPPISLTMIYDPAALPEGVAEEALVIAYYDTTTGKWVELQCVVDTANNKITASVAHFTSFAVISPAPVQYDLTISSTAGGQVTTPGEGTFTYNAGAVVNLVVEPDEGYRFVNWTGDVATIAGVNAASTTITMDGDYSIGANFEAIPPPVKWPLIGGIIGGVVVVGLLVFFLVRRRPA